MADLSNDKKTCHEMIYELYQVNESFKMIMEMLIKDFVDISAFNDNSYKSMYLLGQKELVQGLDYMCKTDPSKLKDEVKNDIDSDDEWN